MALHQRPGLGELEELAALCARQTAGYAVPVAPGCEVEAVRQRLERLDECCASYARSVSALHRRLDEAEAALAASEARLETAADDAIRELYESEGVDGWG